MQPDDITDVVADDDDAGVKSGPSAAALPLPSGATHTMVRESQEGSTSESEWFLSPCF